MNINALRLFVCVGIGMSMGYAGAAGGEDPFVVVLASSVFCLVADKLIVRAFK